MSRKKKLVTTLLALMVLGSLIGVSTYALFSDQESVGANTFSSSTIDLTTSPTSALVTFSGMLPGDSVTNKIVIGNASGSGALRYAISATATNTDAKALKDALVLTIKTQDVAPGANPCLAFDGTQLYTGDLDSTAGKLVGDNAPGAQAGDRVLGVGASETLCFRVAFPIAATGPKSAATTATFIFDAEQTANN